MGFKGLSSETTAALGGSEFRILGMGPGREFEVTFSSNGLLRSGFLFRDLRVSAMCVNAVVSQEQPGQAKSCCTRAEVLLAGAG